MRISVLFVLLSFAAAPDAAAQATTRAAPAAEGAESPKAALVGYAKVLETGDLEAAVRLTDPDAANAREALSAVAPLLVASAELRDAVHEKFDVRIASLAAPVTPESDDLDDVEEAQRADDLVVFEVPMRDGVFESTISTDETYPIEVVRRANRWFVNPIAGGRPHTDEVVAALAEQARVLAIEVDRVAKQVRAGEFEDLMDVESALGDAYAAAAEAAEGD